MSKKGFTLVELIVVITILAILGTIGFIFMQGYSLSSRDAKRINDIGILKKSLELTYLEDGSYPTNSGSIVSFSGATLWTQGTFDNAVRLQTQRVSEVPTDPLTGENYIYSVTQNRGEFQIAAALESQSPNSLISPTYADFVQLYITGDFNGVFLSTNIANNLYILGVPSLIVRTDSNISILDIVSQNRFLKNRAKFIPTATGSLQNSFSSIGLNVTDPSDIIVSITDSNDDFTKSDLENLATNIHNIFSESEFSDNQNVQSIVAANPESDDFVSQVASSTQIVLMDSPLESKVESIVISPSDSLSNPVTNIATNFPTQTVAYDSTQEKVLSEYIDIVNTYSGFQFQQDIPFTLSGQGNPTVFVNGARVTSGFLQNGTNIEMDTPPIGESYTAIVSIPGYDISFTAVRSPAPAVGALDLDFGTKQACYYCNGRITSDYKNFPTLTSPTAFTLSAGGNPTAQQDGGKPRANSGTMSYGTNIEVDPPSPGETRIVEITVNGQTGTFTVTRPANP